MRWFLIISLFWAWSAADAATPAETASDREMQERSQREVLELGALQQAAPKLQAAPRLGLPPDLAKPIHIMFMFADHWEPSSYPVWDPNTYLSEAARLSDFWLIDYRRMASRHHDADGRVPQHNWFCFQLYTPAMERISKACFLGLGEMELHLHHGTADDTYNDNRSEFINKMRAQIAGIQSWGGCITAEPLPQTFFGFVHGDWALDNSRMNQNVRQYCGVNTELHLMRGLGCFGDFTFPSGGSTQPSWFNKIFASRDSDAPKSYDDGALIRELMAYGDPIDQSELMIFEGPGIGGAQTNIDQFFFPSIDRMDDWVADYVHVPGRNNWIFIKVYTHSAQTLAYGSMGQSSLVGDLAESFYTNIERKYNDGTTYTLHYVTAREAYNIARAAVDGHGGDPNQYRDYSIARPANQHFWVNTPYKLLSYDPQRPRADLEIQTPLPAQFEMWARGFTPPVTVQESDLLTSSAFHLTDGVTSSTADAPVTFRDPTPSKYYRIFKSPPAVRQGWDGYP